MQDKVMARLTLLKDIKISDLRMDEAKRFNKPEEWSELISNQEFFKPLEIHKALKI